MKFSDANKILENLPYTGTRKGRFFYNFVVEHDVRRMLELGFAYGASTSYFAAALDDQNGHIDTVDVLDSHHGTKLEEVSAELGLGSRISIYRETSSYTWFLKKKIEEQTRDGVCHPIYDLCFIDGPKDWTNDGAAFFMVDKLLKPGGWIIFDDYAWSYRQQEALSGSKYKRGYVFEKMSEEEWSVSQVEAIYRLLVRQHPGYASFSVVDNCLALAQKTQNSTMTGQLKFSTALTPSYMLFAALQKTARIWRRLTAKTSNSSPIVDKDENSRPYR